LIPDNTTYLTADSDGTSATDAKSGKQYITWYLADGLAAGASKTLTFTALVGTCADGTSVDNVAYYEETATKPDPDDTSALPKTASNKATFTVSVPATPAASADSTASTSTPTGSTTTATTTNNALAQTGDSFSIAGIVGLMIASLIAAGYVLYRRCLE
jgi:LPXTG-motif cell wall-anchored protein